MKVFICRRQGSYSGGLAVVAANTKEEAFDVLFSEPHNNWMLDYTDKVTRKYTEDLSKMDSEFYPRSHWQEMPILEADTIVPRVISEDGYTE